MKKILVQFDTDPGPSVFDRVVAVDSDVDQLFSYGDVSPEIVEPLVHGAIFTRGVPDLRHTAIFVGGSNVAAGEALLKKVKKTFFGPMRVSVMMDSNGSNTTAAAAVLSARKHLKLTGCQAVVLAGTGPVGLRAVQLLAGEGAQVRVGSRSSEKAAQAIEELRGVIQDGAQVVPCATATRADLERALSGAELVIAAGAAGVELLPADLRKGISTMKVAIDLNAVPPAGIAGVEVFDKAIDREGVVCYGAIGVGGLKMKIHKAAVRQLFSANDQVLDTAEIYRIGEALITQ